MKIHFVLSYLGLVLEIFGIFALLPNIIAWIYGEQTFIPFLVSAIIAFVSGIMLEKRFERGELDLSSAMVLSALSFIFISLIGSIPYLAYTDPVSAAFESFSGFTTTGLSVFKPETLPYSILFWRSLTQWLGGLGILLIFLLLMPSPGMSSFYIYEAEQAGQKVETNVHNSVRKTAIIYCVYTAIGIFALLIAGMPAFDSISTMFSTISTGGFSVHSESIAYYNSVLIEFIISIFMIIGATSFFIHNKLFRKEFMYYIKNPETRIFWVLIAVFSIMLAFAFIPSPIPIEKGIFHAVSALTTTGFTNTENIPELAMFLMIILMIIGGYAGSTAGGLKLIRIGIISKAFLWLIKKSSLPLSAVVQVKFDGRVVKDNELTIVSIFSFIYLFILLVSSMVISFLGYSPLDSFFIAASAEGTVGLSTIDIASMHVVGKIILIFNMLVGRLELIPLLVLLRYIFVRRSIL